MEKQASENKILLSLSKRLGLESTTVEKADEYLRVLQNKTVTQALSDVTKTVICLDLACDILGVGFDKETAVKLSGLRKTVYQNNLNNVEKLLNLNKCQTIAELCVKFNCTSVKEDAEFILTKYKENNTAAAFNHPQYVAAAIYTACKIKQIKMQKSQFISISRLKQNQWKELESNFMKFIDVLGLSNKYEKKKNNLLNDISESVEGEESHKKRNITEENQIEEYEVWKKRILDEAREALRKTVT